MGDTKKRKTVIVYLLCSFLRGMDYLIIMSNLLVYFQDVIKTKHPVFYYGLTIGANSLSVSISGIVFSRMVDKTHRAKLFVCIGLVFGMIGNLVYAVYVFPILPVIGRFIAGVNGSFTSIVTGEFIRIHDKKGGVRSQWWLAATYSIGMVLGPLASLCFVDINITLGIVQLNSSNVIGVFMSALYLLALIIVLIFACDCDLHASHKADKQFDKNNNLVDEDPVKLSAIETAVEIYEDRALLDNSIVGTSHNDKFEEVDKIELAKQAEKIEFMTRSSLQHIDDRIYDQESSYKNVQLESALTGVAKFLVDPIVLNSSKMEEPTAKIFATLKQFLFNANMRLMLISTFHFAFCSMSLAMFTPLINYKLFDWSVHRLTIIYTIYSLLYSTLLFILSVCCVTGPHIYGTSLFCITSLLVNSLVLLTMKVVILTNSLKVTLITLYVLTYSTIWLLEEVLLRVMTAKMVPTRVQSMTEAIRQAITQSAFVLASVLVPVTFKYQMYYAVVSAIVTAIIFIVYIVRWRSLSDIKKIIW